MAGKAKHMERSKYSNGVNNHIFGVFEQKASIKKNEKHKRSIAEKLKKLFIKK